MSNDSGEGPGKAKKADESLQAKIDDFNLFLEELESEWIDEPEEPAKVAEPEVVKPTAKPKSKPKDEKKLIPKPRPVDPSTQEIHVDLETGEVTFDDLDEILAEEGQEVVDELLDTEVSETVEIDVDGVKQQVDAMKASVMPTEIIADEYVEEEEKEDDTVIIGEIVAAQKPEQYAYNYLFARFPVGFLLILVPQFVGLLANILVSPSKILSDDESSSIGTTEIQGNQNHVIDSYLFAVKVTLVILLAFFLCYRWSTMQNDGSYGYWLTQGVNRRKFFIETVYKFLFIIYFGIFIGILGLIYLNGIHLDLITFVQLNLLILSHILIMVSVGIIIGVLIKNPESASLFFIIASAVNYAFNTKDNFWNRLLQSDLQYKAPEADGWLALVASLGLALIINLISLRVHTRLDMEL